MPDPHEPVDALRHLPIEENGEPMVDFLSEGILHSDSDRFHYRRERWMRRGLYERLLQADAALRPKGYRLTISEGWRSPIIQRRMFMAVELKFRERYPDLEGQVLRDLVERFTAPMDLDVPPPHTTGGAVDLALADLDGVRLEHSAPFDSHDDASFPFAALGIAPEARRHRDILAEALLPTGITNYPSEYWHWSWGDQGWAYRGGHRAAFYCAVEPVGWTSAPEDDHDGPLVFIDD